MRVLVPILARRKCAPICRRRIDSRYELHSVAPRIFGEESRRTFHLVVVPCRNPRRLQARLEPIQGCLVGQPQRRVPLLRRPEVPLDADVDLLSAALEPEAASDGERSGFGQFRKAEQLAEEVTCLALAAGRRGQLDVIDSSERYRR